MIRIVASVACLLSLGVVSAQDLVITNARIFDGTGATIEHGSVVIAEGRIASVSEGETDAPGERIDAKNMAVLPGLIDTHRHDSDAPAFEELLSLGVTTVMVPGGAVPDILALRADLAERRTRGPRLFTTGSVFTAPNDWPTPLFANDPDGRRKAIIEVVDPDVARSRVADLAGMGVDAIKVVYEKLDEEVLFAIADEANHHGLDTYVHVTNIDGMLKAVSLGADRLTHTPGDGLITDGPLAANLRSGHIAVSTTVSFDTVSKQEDRLNRHLLNIRHLWDEGVTVAFGTDSPPSLGPTIMTEVMALNRVLNAQEIVASLTRNAAEYLGLGNKIGTLEHGKMADIVIVDGDPLDNIADLEDVVVVIQGGRIVVDNR